MLIGSWLLNLIISTIAFLSVFIGSVLTNSLQTSFFRGGVTFVSFFILTYFFRWLWTYTFKDFNNQTKKDNDIQIDPVVEGKDTIINEYSNEEINKASQYVKDLIND